MHDEGHYVVDENGNAWFYVIDTDITNAVAEKEKISERKTELEQIINNIPSGVGAYRKDNGVVRCIAANPSFADLIGISPDDLIGKSFDEFTSTVHPDDIAGLRYNSITRLDLYKKTDFTYRRFNSSTGRYVWLHLDGRLVRQPDGSELAYFSYTDVNSLKDTEQELRYRKDIYDLAIQGAHLFVWEYDIKRRRAKIDDQNAIDFCRRLFGTAGPVVDNIPACIQDRTMRKCRAWIGDEIVDAVIAVAREEYGFVSQLCNNVARQAVGHLVQQFIARGVQFLVHDRRRSVDHRGEQRDPQHYYFFRPRPDVLRVKLRLLLRDFLPFFHRAAVYQLCTKIARLLIYLPFQFLIRAFRFIFHAHDLRQQHRAG